MATEYRYTGHKKVGPPPARIVLEGSITNPERYVDLKGQIELEDEEVESLKSSGIELRRVSEEKSASGDNDGDDKDSREAQQEGQTPSGAQGPPARGRGSGKPSTGDN